MQCNHCGAELVIRREFCPKCGERVTFSLDQIVGVAHDDAAVRRNAALNSGLRTAIFIVVALIALIEGFAYYFDKRLLFDGSALPSAQANAAGSVEAANGTTLAPYSEPRPLPPFAHNNPRMLSHRLDPVRSAMRLANEGLTNDFEIDIERGLAFLGKAQERDGGWPVAMTPKNWPGDETGNYAWGRVGVSSLVLLAFMGNGHTWLKEGNLPRSKFAEAVFQGVKFLVRSQDPETGRFGVGEGERVHFMYNQGMATLALSEAAALSGDPELLARVQKAVDLIVKTQTATGGWNYFGHKENDDISVSAWQVQALAAAREAGAKVPDETLNKALELFRRATIKGRVAYRLPNDDGIYTPSLAAMGLMVRQLLGESAALPDLKLLESKVAEAAPKVKIPDYTHGWLPKEKTAAARAAFDPYMLYYSTYGLFFSGGAEWKTWNKTACKAIIDMQDYDGGWHPNDINAYKGGTYYSTALCILALQVHHRIHHSLKMAGDNKGE